MSRGKGTSIYCKSREGDVPYVEGDGFAAEVRGPIQPEEYGEYVEFSSSD